MTSENLEFFAAVVGAGGARVNAALEAVGLADRANQIVATQSGGQGGRVSLATGTPVADLVAELGRSRRMPEDVELA